MVWAVDHSQYSFDERKLNSFQEVWNSLGYSEQTERAIVVCSVYEVILSKVLLKLFFILIVSSTINSTLHASFLVIRDVRAETKVRREEARKEAERLQAEKKEAERLEAKKKKEDSKKKFVRTDFEKKREEPPKGDTENGTNGEQERDNM